MPDYTIMKATDLAKQPAAFRGRYPTPEALAEAGWWTQRKYDGCMGVAVFEHGLPAKMLSRTGENYTISCSHILAEINSMVNASDDGPVASFVVLGEVWKEGMSFPEIGGAFRKGAPSNLGFVAHDLLPIGLDTTLPYVTRFQQLCSFVTRGAHVVTAMTYPRALNPTALALEWQGLGGYDGAMLKDPLAGYTVGTCKRGEIVKVKPTLSLDLRCTAAEIYPGGKTGREVLTLSVVYHGVVSRVGSGVPHHLVPDDVIGRIVEVGCLGVTEDGHLREPRFKAIRFDKEAADGESGQPVL